MEEKINLSGKFKYYEDVKVEKITFENMIDDIKNAIKELKEEVKINFSNVDINCYVEKDCAEHFNEIIDKIFGKELTK